METLLARQQAKKVEPESSIDPARKSEANASKPASEAKTSANHSPPPTGDIKRALENAATTARADTRSFERIAGNQGALGRTFDFLKNNLGGSSENRTWYHPAALWSNVLDYDSGSFSTRARLSKISTAIRSAQNKLNNGDSESAARSLKQVSESKPNGSITLKSTAEVLKYNESQRHGVDFLADTTVMAVTGLCLVPGAGVAPLAMGAFVGGNLKYALKKMDGNYASSSDHVSGAIVGAAPIFGRYLGGAAYDAIGWGASRLGATQAVMSPAARVFGYATESGGIGGMLTSSQKYSELKNGGATTADALRGSVSNFGSGFAAGFGAGIVLGAPVQYLLSKPAHRLRAGEQTKGLLGNDNGQFASELRQAYSSYSISGRSDTLLKEVNQVLDRRGIPPLNSLKDTKSLSRLLLAGEHGTDAGIELINKTRFGFVTDLGHELKHHEQLYLTARRAADLAGVGKEFGPNEIARYANLHLKLTGNYRSLDVDFAINVLKYRNGLALTAREAARADRLIAAQANYPRSFYSPSNLFRYFMNPLEIEARSIEAYTRIHNTPYLRGGTSAPALIWHKISGDKRELQKRR